MKYIKKFYKTSDYQDLEHLSSIEYRFYKDKIIFMVDFWKE